MIRKRILTSIVALAAYIVTPLVLAGDVLPGRIIIGMDVGYASRSGTLNSDYRTTTNLIGAFAASGGPGAPLANVSAKVSDSGTTQGILAGYDYDWQEFFFGIEGYIDWGRYENVKHHHFFGTNPGVNAALGGFAAQFISEATYIQGTRYGAVVRAGMRIPPIFKPYIRVGAEYSDHELSITNTFTVNAPLPWDHFTYKKGLWQWVMGVGLELPVWSDVVAFRFEYNYLPGRNIQFNDNIDTLGAWHHYKAKTHSGKLAFVINID